MFSPRIPSARNAPRAICAGRGVLYNVSFYHSAFLSCFYFYFDHSTVPPRMPTYFQKFFHIFFAIRYNLRRSCAYFPAKAKEENSRVQKEKGEGTHPHRTAIQRIPDGAQRRTSDDGFGRRRKAPPAKIERRTRRAARGGGTSIVPPPLPQETACAARLLPRGARFLFFVLSLLRALYPSCAPSASFSCAALPLCANCALYRSQ